MSIRVLEFEPQLVFPTQKFLLCLIFFAKVGVVSRELQVGSAHQIRNSALSVRVDEKEGQSVGLIIERGTGGVRHVQNVDAKSPHFILGESVNYTFGEVEVGKGLTIKALVSKVQSK